MAEFTAQEGRDWVRSGKYSKPIYAIEIIPKDFESQLANQQHEAILNGGVLRFATEYISAGEYLYYGLLEKLVGMRKSANLSLIGKPVESNGTMRIRISGQDLPDWLSDLKNVDFNGASVTLKVGWRNQPFEDMRQLDQGFAANSKISANGTKLEFRFRRFNAYLDKRHGYLNGGKEHQANWFPLGKVARCIVDLESSSPLVDPDIRFLELSTSHSSTYFDGFSDAYYDIKVDQVYLDGLDFSFTHPQDFLKNSRFAIDAYPVEYGFDGVIGEFYRTAKEATADVTNPEAAATHHPYELISRAISFADDEYLPNSGFSTIINGADYDNSAPYQMGFNFVYKGVTGQLSTSTWQNVLDEIIGGSGGAWVNGRNGETILINYFDSGFKSALEISGSIEKSDFSKHSRAKIKTYSEVVITGTEYDKEDDASYSAESELTETSASSSLQPRTIKSAITNKEHATTLAKKIKAGALETHTFKDCRAAMFYEVGDKLTFGEGIDDVPEGTTALVVSVPVSPGDLVVVI